MSIAFNPSDDNVLAAGATVQPGGVSPLAFGMLIVATVVAVAGLQDGHVCLYDIRKFSEPMLCEVFCLALPAAFAVGDPHNPHLFVVTVL